MLYHHTSSYFFLMSVTYSMYSPFMVKVNFLFGDEVIFFFFFIYRFRGMLGELQPERGRVWRILCVYRAWPSLRASVPQPGSSITTQEPDPETLTKSSQQCEYINVPDTTWDCSDVHSMDEVCIDVHPTPTLPTPIRTPTLPIPIRTPTPQPQPTPIHTPTPSPLQPSHPIWYD